MQASRIIQIISTRTVGDEKQYIFSTTWINYNGDSKTETKFIAPKEVSTHLKTGNWHTISLTNQNNFQEEPIAIQVLQHFPLQVKFEKYIQDEIQRGEVQFSRKLGK